MRLAMPLSRSPLGGGLGKVLLQFVDDEPRYGEREEEAGQT